MDMDRRTFLKGLLGATAVATVALPAAPPIDHKALRQMSKNIGFGQAYGATDRLRLRAEDYKVIDIGDGHGPNRGGDVFPDWPELAMDGVVVPRGEWVLITGASDPGNNGIWEVTSKKNPAFKVQVTVDDWAHQELLDLKRPVPAPERRKVSAHYTWPQPRRARA